VCLVRFPQQLNLELQAPRAASNKILILNDNQCETLGQGINSRPFKLLLIMLTNATCGSMWLTNLYQAYGRETYTPEQLALVGAASLLMQGVTRTLWIALMERIGFKRLYMLTMVIHLGVCVLQFTI
jgi:Na+/melibiose symporter-like transporter